MDANIGSWMPFEFECGDGWVELIAALSTEITAHAKVTGLDTVATQVKEKHGSLRYYVDFGDDEICRLIDEAEEKSESICEVCGKPGRLMRSGWLKTRCEPCASDDL